MRREPSATEPPAAAAAAFAGLAFASALFQLVDAVVEVYLGGVVGPFVRVHERFYAALNAALRRFLDDRAPRVPPWFTANFVTYLRTSLVLPTLLLLAWDFNWPASAVVLAVDFGDFLDGVVARFWADEKKKRTAAPAASSSSSSSSPPSRRESPAASDDESFGTSRPLEVASCRLKSKAWCLTLALFLY
jgi:hypothetical protein